MKSMSVIAVSVLLPFFTGSAIAQDETRPLPLSDFVDLFTDERATSAQKEEGLKEGTYYQGTIVVSDVQLYTIKGKGQRTAEIIDRNLDDGCYVLMLRTDDVDKALTLKKGDAVTVKGRFREIGLHVAKFVMDCEIYYALFKEGEILEVLQSAH